MIRTMTMKDIPDVCALWNMCVRQKDVLYFEMTPAYFERKFLNDPNYDPQYSLVAEENGQMAGFISGISKKVFLDLETNENTPGYITCLFVSTSMRGKGIGRQLTEALLERFRDAGKSTVVLNNDNPVNLDWHIPGTPGHDHNNAPGVDVDGTGLPFFKALGFEETAREIAMYLDLKKYQPWVELESRRQMLAENGIFTGRYDPELNYDYDTLCDRVGSEYWRSVIRSELACYREQRPNKDIRFIPNGKVPAGPRPMLVATHDRHIVAFTGPVDKQESGRGWFCGIFTDPTYERKGIASVLFNLLMQEFIEEGAEFSTLFTGENNPAQKIYKRAGFTVRRTFAQMKRSL